MSPSFVYNKGNLLFSQISNRLPLEVAVTLFVIHAQLVVAKSSVRSSRNSSLNSSSKNSSSEKSSAEKSSSDPSISGAASLLPSLRH